MSSSSKFLLFIFIFLNSRFSYTQNLLSEYNRKADSLSDCGYFKEELAYRKKILAAIPKNSSQYKIAKVHHDIAEMSFWEKSLEPEKADKIRKSIFDFYKTLTVEEQKNVEIEIDRLKANQLSSEGKYNEAIAIFKSALKKVPSKSIKAAELHLNLGQSYSADHNYFDAIAHFKKAIEYFEKNGWKNHYATALAYNELAFAYDYANTEKEMIPTFEKALHIWSTYYSADASIVSVAYNDAMFTATEYGDRKKAAEYQSRYDEYMTAFMDPKNSKNYKSDYLFDRFHALIMYHLSSIRYYDLNFDEGKIIYHVKALEKLFAISPKNWVEKEIGVLLSTYDGASHAFYMNKQPERALEYIGSMEKLATNDFFKMKASANRAMLYYYKYDFAKSMINNQKALDYLQILGFKSSYLTLLTLKAENLANLKKINEAKAAVKEVFRAEFAKDIPIDQIKIKDFGEINNSSYINIFVHSGLAYRKIYELNGRSKSDLKVIKNLYKLAGEMFKGYYRDGFFNPNLENHLNSIKEGMMFCAIQSPNDKTYLAECINTIENISSQHLWKQFLSKYSHNLNLSKELINKRNEAVIELSYLIQIEQKTQKDKEREQILTKELGIIDTEIEQKYPNYGRFQSADFRVTDLQGSLGQNQVLVKYYVTDSSVFACKINYNSLELKYLGHRKGFEQLSKNYHHQISKIDFDYISNSQELFNRLLKPLALKEDNKVVFVPENFLNFCPFETLVDQNKQPFALSYTVSYANSLKFSQKIFTDKKPSYDNFLTGFAPKYKDGIGVTRSANGHLIYTGAELNTIAGIFKSSSIYINENATKSNFLRSVGNSNIHHLAMHSVLDEKDYEYSSLIFQNNEKLHFYELYALNFPSEMVVLSACNTGVGQYLNGEGLMSISRALNYAGVQSTVNSLWQVPDKETSELMSYFYEYLNEGLAKDEALAKAKRKFIKNNPLKIHPYYWSGFILNGDVSPLSKPQNRWLYGVVAFLVIAVGTAYYYLKVKSPIA